MDEHKYEGQLVDFCPQCGGIWTDDNELGHIALTQKVTFKVDAVSKTFQERWKGSQPDRKLACPKCHRTMEEFDYLGLGVFLDRCPDGHGIFLDHSELEKAQILVERNTPGMRPGPAAPTGKPKTCPHCAIGLEHRDYEGVHLDECCRCGGIWADTGELGLVLKRRKEVFSPDQKKAAENVSNRPTEEVNRPPVLCPVCKDVMERVIYGYDTDIVVDKCAHGTWLDKGEIERVQAYIEGSEDLQEVDRTNWGGALVKVKADVMERRAAAVKKFQWSRFGLLDKLGDKLADIITG